MARDKTAPVTLKTPWGRTYDQEGVWALEAEAEHFKDEADRYKADLERALDREKTAQLYIRLLEDKAAYLSARIEELEAAALAEGARHTLNPFHRSGVLQFSPRPRLSAIGDGGRAI